MELLRWQTIPDLLALAAALYLLLRWANQARAMRIALLVVALHALALVARKYELIVTSLVLDGAAVLAIVMLFVVFQPELRRAFVRLDSLLRLGPRSAAALEPASHAIASALFSLAAVRTGAIVVIVRRDSLADMTDGGVEIGAEITAGLIQAVFQKTSPLHDGAAIFERGRLSRANVILPLTQRAEVPFYFGTRHRAAMGLAERCDAIVLVASEERGEVAVMAGRDIRRMNGEAELVTWLDRLQRQDGQGWLRQAARRATDNLTVKLAALGLACLIWFLSFAAPGSTVRTIAIPVEFLNVPPGMDIAQQSENHINAELLGKAWLMDTSRVASAVARFDLHNAPAGSVTLRVTQQNLNLPPGIQLASVTPRIITLRLTPRAAITSTRN